jgi:hypothetical protein
VFSSLLEVSFKFQSEKEENCGSSSFSSFFLIALMAFLAKEAGEGDYSF